MTMSLQPQRVVAVYEEKQREVLAENRELRSALENLQAEHKTMTNQQACASFLPHKCHTRLMTTVTEFRKSRQELFTPILCSRSQECCCGTLSCPITESLCCQS